MKSKKFLFVALIVLLLSFAPFAASCADSSAPGGSGAGEAEKNQKQDTIDGFLETATEKVTHDVPDMDFGGHNFKVVDRDGIGVYWVTVDIYAEAENGEPINDAVYRRNRILEDKFNIEISEIRQTDADFMNFVQKSVQAGSDDFDVFVTIMQNAGMLITKAHLADLYNMPYFDFSKPWWDKTLNDSMTVAGKLYGAAGAITTTTNDATWAVLFNKDLNKTYELEDPYQQVKDGKWTLDLMYKNSRTATKDLNGDGILTPEDQWGTIGQHECAYCLFAASGQKIVEKDGKDLPVLALNSERTVSVVAKIVEFMTDNDVQIQADDYYGKYDDVWTQITSIGFSESRALYEITNFDMVKTLRNMEANFGILPLPKYDEAQPQYYSTMQYNNATVMCVPVTVSDTARTGAVLEAWAAESVDTLTKAYYEITLKGKYSRDDESQDMLDLIFSTRVMDQGMFFNWSGMQAFFEDFVTKKNLTFASQYEKAEPKWITAIEKTIQAIQEGN